MPSLPSSSAESGIAKGYLLFSQCEMTASWMAGSLWPGAQTSEISGMSLNTFRPVRRPGPSSLPMNSAGLAADAVAGAAVAAGAAGLPDSVAVFDPAFLLSASLSPRSAPAGLGGAVPADPLVPSVLQKPL